MPALARNEGSSRVTLLNQTVTANPTTGEACPGVDFFSAVNIIIKASSVTGTSPTFDVYLQQLLPDLATWTDIAASAQINTTANIVVSVVSAGSSTFAVTDTTLAAGTIKTIIFSRAHRIKIKTGGTNPSALFNIVAEYVQ